MVAAIEHENAGTLRAPQVVAASTKYAKVTVDEFGPATDDQEKGHAPKGSR